MGQRNQTPTTTPGTTCLGATDEAKGAGTCCGSAAFFFQPHGVSGACVILGGADLYINHLPQKGIKGFAHKENRYHSKQNQRMG